MVRTLIRSGEFFWRRLQTRVLANAATTLPRVLANAATTPVAAFARTRGVNPVAAFARTRGPFSVLLRLELLGVNPVAAFARTRGVKSILWAFLATALPALFLLLAAGPVRAQSSRLPASLQDVGFDQKLDAQVPLNLEFIDEHGGKVRLAECVDGKPVILVLGYYRCPMLCGKIMNGLVQALLDLPFDAGKEFNVINVSIDPRETPDLAAAKKETYMERYGRRGAAGGWHFLTGKEDAIKRLAGAVGFRYTYDATNDQFAHASGLVLLTPTGKTSRYFYDIRYSPRDLRLGLVEASQGKVGSPVDQVLLFCFHYDPVEGRYGPAVMNFVRLGGILTLLSIGGFMGRMWWRERRAARQAAKVE